MINTFSLGITSFFDTTTAKPNKEVAIVFVFPIEGLELDTALIKVFDNNKLINQKIIEISQ